MNVVIETHLTTTSHGTLLVDVAAAITRAFDPPQVKDGDMKTSVFVTDDVEFANNACETNQIVVLISGQPETVNKGVSVCRESGVGIRVFEKLYQLIHQQSH